MDQCAAIECLDVVEFTVIDIVNQRISAKASERLAEVMTSPACNLLNFAREVKLTKSEVTCGIQSLKQVGWRCDDRCQEFILRSDILGLSTLVTAQNTRKPDGCSESTVLGLFHVESPALYALGDDIANGALAEPCHISGAVRRLDGEPISGARIDVWPADEEGLYDVPHDSKSDALARATFIAGPNEDYCFRSIVASPYSIPHQGPGDRLLGAFGRHSWRPAHIHFLIEAVGYEPLITHVFRDDDSYLPSDAASVVCRPLIANWVRYPAGPTPDGSVSATSFCTLNFDFVLAPAAAQV
jgi:hydroxyquinol 1,2-dioxygenase